nr:AtpZ/AtpI family protein [uncultured Butyrivibrio sp.]
MRQGRSDNYNMQLRDLSKLIGQFAMVGQLGLSLLMPLLLCLIACYLLCVKLSVGAWIYIPGFILGLGGSMMTAYKVYLSVVHKEEKKKKVRDPNEVYFNKHF